MRWLLWKDYRQNRIIVFTGLFLLMVPYGFVAIVGWRFERIWPELFQKKGGWPFFLAAASLYSLGISQLTLALTGGNAFAGERTDRSAEFLFSLPISRGKILGSKLLLALTITGVIWVNALVYWLLVQTSVVVQALEHELHGVEVLTVMATIGVMFFSVAWFFSSLLSSPTFAVAGALAAPAVIMSGIVSMAYLLELNLNNGVFEHLFRGICLLLAGACFAAGTWSYLRRVEP